MRFSAEQWINRLNSCSLGAWHQPVGSCKSNKRKAIRCAKQVFRNDDNSYLIHLKNFISFLCFLLQLDECDWVQLNRMNFNKRISLKSDEFFVVSFDFMVKLNRKFISPAFRTLKFYSLRRHQQELIYFWLFPNELNFGSSCDELVEFDRRRTPSKVPEQSSCFLWLFTLRIPYFLGFIYYISRIVRDRDLKRVAISWIRIGDKPNWPETNRNMVMGSYLKLYEMETHSRRKKKKRDNAMRFYSQWFLDDLKLDSKTEGNILAKDNFHLQ